MASTLILGVLAAFVATTLAAALRRSPTRTRCPECGSATTPVRPEAWLLKRMPDLVLRWCQACSWQGWGRHGAEWIPGHPAAHDSGFIWGEDAASEDAGFRFADRAPGETSAEPPHHPSGFRFGEPSATPRPAHPSGFSWADSHPEATRGGGEPARFRWAPPASERGAPFARGRRRPPTYGGFSWKDAG